ncbi:hypothetical protein [Chryseobacterium lathyri]|uniref:hypothetical protein n=1 Tax=Chryseobacterium lathyri TaxID=395933 RepID=UPI001CBD407C|nr:hypothetical protein [Chryseobacterium lathyri]
MKTTNLLRIFLASPGDVEPERKMIYSLKDEWDLLFGGGNDIKFEIRGWENYSYPGVGEDAQDVVNKTIKDDYEIFIGIFWQKLGTQTKRAASGTVEEFERAMTKFKQDKENTHILMYFKTSTPDNINDINLEEFSRVKEFKNKISKEEGVLYKDFDNTDELKKYLSIHVSSLVKDKFSKKDEKSEKKQLDINLPDSNEKNIKIFNDEIEKLERLAKNIDDGEYMVEQKELKQLAENTSNFFNSNVQVTSRISSLIKEIGEKMNIRTDEIGKANSIKDERLKQKKVKKIMNNMADDFDNYSNGLDLLIPEFSETFNSGIENYTNLILKSTSSDSIDEENKKQFNDVLPDFYESLNGATNSIASFLETFTRLSADEKTKFGKSKRKAELSTNNIFKVFIQGKKVFKELLDVNNLS